MPKLRVNNTGIYCEVTGQGEPLLFIHGLTSSSRSWKKQVSLFSQHYRVITFDIRGHGRSDKPMEPYSIELFAADTGELLRTLGAGSTHVVGFSMGGMVAFQLAVDAPELVRSLVAVNCCPEGSMRTFNNGVECVKHMLGLQINDIKHRRRANDGKQSPASVMERPHQSVIQRMAVTNKLAYANAFGALMKWSVADRLDTIKCPTLMITGDGDFVPVSIKEEYASKMPCAELVVINNSRHATPRERTEEFNAVLLEFVSRH
ncbi:MAG: alpha/beta hydrolase [Dehalococcoidia bacterium]|nr:alpha/beta hydrolase [Dehalococcoidia bacterium]